MSLMNYVSKLPKAKLVWLIPHDDVVVQWFISRLDVVTVSDASELRAAYKSISLFPKPALFVGDVASVLHLLPTATVQTYFVGKYSELAQEHFKAAKACILELRDSVNLRQAFLKSHGVVLADCVKYSSLYSFYPLLNAMKLTQACELPAKNFVRFLPISDQDYENLYKGKSVTVPLHYGKIRKDVIQLAKMHHNLTKTPLQMFRENSIPLQFAKDYQYFAKDYSPKSVARRWALLFQLERHQHKLGCLQVLSYLW